MNIALKVMISLVFIQGIFGEFALKLGSFGRPHEGSQLFFVKKQVNDF